MSNEIMFFRFLPYIIQTAAIIMACLAGILVYTGLSSKVERRQTRIRIKTQMVKSRNKVIENTKNSKAEEWLEKAKYPLGLNGIRYYLMLWGVVLFLLTNYVFIPFIINGPGNEISIALMVIVLVTIFLLPNNPYSLFVLVNKRVIDYYNTKKHAEIFMLYDLLINEIEMMKITRINTYNILRNIKPYFVVLEKPMTKLLSTWSNDEGPIVALDKFEKELDSNEAKALISVMKNLDEIDRETALSHLRGMHSMFIRTQIENYRRKMKLTTDLFGIPIKTTHFLIILNFLVLIVTMVSVVMSSSRL